MARRELKGWAKLATARRICRLKFPYLTELMDKLAPVECPGLGTFGVTEHLVLMVDPEVLDRWPLKKVAFVFAHEVFHPLHNHAARARRMHISEAEARAWNWCADACINPPVAAVFGWAPDDVIFPATLGQEENIPVEVRFAMLRDQSEDGQARAPGEQGQPQQGGGGPQSPQDGSSSPGDQEPGGGGESGPPSGVGQTGGDWGGRCGSGAGCPLPNEPRADHPASRPEAQVAGAVRAAAESIRQHEAKMAGSVPGELLRIADDVLAPPKVPWQQKLLRASRRAVAWKAGAVDYRFDGVSRKQGAIGFGHGRPLLPRLRAPEVNAEIWCDTSGSMSPGELATGLSESSGALRAAGGKVRFGALDTEMHTLKEVRSVAEMRRLLVGGGGTDFRSAFSELARRPKHKRPSVLVVITDGYAVVPARPPADVNIIWLLVGSLTTKPCEWGECIEAK